MSSEPIRRPSTLPCPPSEDPYVGPSSLPATFPPPPPMPSVDELATHDLQKLMRLAIELGHDEVSVLATIAERLLGGQRTYGLLDVANDTRDWHREALEECADGLVYAAVGLMRKAR